MFSSRGCFGPPEGSARAGNCGVKKGGRKGAWRKALFAEWTCGEFRSGKEGRREVRGVWAFCVRNEVFVDFL